MTTRSAHTRRPTELRPGQVSRAALGTYRGRFWLTFVCVTLPLVVEKLMYDVVHRFLWTDRRPVS